MKILSSRILPGNIEVKGYVDIKKEKLCKEAFEFFCDKFKKESSANSAWDTEEEFKVNVHIKMKKDIFSGKKTYDVYITPKEHP